MSGPDNMAALRIPPHSKEAEQSLLGALLLDNRTFERISWLGEQAFYLDQHRRIFRCLAKMIEANRQADMVTVCEEMGDDLEKAGGPAYIAAIAANTASTANVKRYAELVYEKSIQRELAQVATEIAEEALSPVPMDMGRMLDEAESKILRISESTLRQAQGPTDLKPVLARVFERIDYLHAQGNASGVTGVPSGFVDLDQKTAGFQPGDLIIVAGRPSMGKTAFALNVAEHVALDKAVNLPVLVFSMEMSSAQLTTRMLGSLAKIDQHKMRTGRLGDEEWAKLTDAIGHLQEARIQIDDSGALTALELRARARRVKRRFGKLGLVVVDYLQLMEAKSKGENRATEVAEISRSLKAMAKELDVPVIALSQLSRKVDERPDKRPLLSDLRESGAIEQDADVILFLYREEVYNPECAEERKGLAEVIIGKQRNGPVGTCILTFIGRNTRFENYAGSTTGLDFQPRRKATRPRNFEDFDGKGQA